MAEDLEDVVLAEEADEADEAGLALADEEAEEPEAEEAAAVAASGAQEDDFSAWVAATEDVDVAAGDAPLAAADSAAAEEENVEADALADEPAEDEDEAAALLLAMAPRKSEAEHSIARSLLLGGRGRQQPAEEDGQPSAAEEVVAAVDEALPVAEEVALDEDGEDAAAPENAQVEEPSAKARAAAEEELLLLEQEDSDGEPEVGEADAAAAALGLDPIDPGADEEAAAEEPAVDSAEEEAAKGLAELAAAAAAEEEAPADPNAWLAEANAEVWDVDELDEQAEVFGASEAARGGEEATVGVGVAQPATPPRSEGRKATVGVGVAQPTTPSRSEGRKAAVAGDEVMEIDSEDDGEAAAPDPPKRASGLGRVLDGAQLKKVTVVKLQPKCKAQPAPPRPKRPAADVDADAPAQPAKAARHEASSNGQSYDLKHVAVNFLDVGRAYAKAVLKNADGDAAFDWEGVRTCVQHLASEHGLQVLGVVPKGFEGEDSWSNETCGVPEDIKMFCESVEETSDASCSALAVARARQPSCRFVDGEGGQTEPGEDELQVRYTFDPDIGAFKAAEGSLSPDGAGAGD